MIRARPVFHVGVSFEVPVEGKSNRYSPETLGVIQAEALMLTLLESEFAPGAIDISLSPPCDAGLKWYRAYFHSQEEADNAAQAVTKLLRMCGAVIYERT